MKKNLKVLALTAALALNANAAQVSLSGDESSERRISVGMELDLLPFWEVSVSAPGIFNGKEIMASLRKTEGRSNLVGIASIQNFSPELQAGVSLIEDRCEDIAGAESMSTSIGPAPGFSQEIGNQVLAGAGFGSISVTESTPPVVLPSSAEVFFNYAGNLDAAATLDSSKVYCGMNATIGLDGKVAQEGDIIALSGGSISAQKTTIELGQRVGLSLDRNTTSAREIEYAVTSLVVEADPTMLQYMHIGFTLDANQQKADSIVDDGSTPRTQGSSSIIFSYDPLGTLVETSALNVIEQELTYNAGDFAVNAMDYSSFGAPVDPSTLGISGRLSLVGDPLDITSPAKPNSYMDIGVKVESDKNFRYVAELSFYPVP